MSEPAHHIDEVLEDYATSRVPEHRTMGGLRIGMVNGGLAFAVPGLVTGLEIGGALGFEASLWAFLTGGFLLSLLGSVTGILGMQNRLTSCMTLKFAFGRYGANLLSLVFAVSLLGWYGVNMDLFSGAAQALCLQLFDVSLDVWKLEVGAGVLVTATAFLGFRSVQRLSGLLVPLLFLVVLYMLYSSLNYTGEVRLEQVPQELSFGQAVSAVVGSFIVGVALMPDFSRFAARRRDAVVGSFLPFMVICTFVYFVAAYAGSVVGKTDALAVMLGLGLGGFAFFLLITSGWIANAVNLYSAGLGFNAVFRRFSEWKIIVVAGALGTLAASLNILDSFTSFLFTLSIVFAPVAAVYTTDFFLVRSGLVYDLDEIGELPGFHWPAILAWAAGIGASVLANNDLITITTIEACDAVIVTVPAYLLFMKLGNQFVKDQVAEVPQDN